MPNVLRRSAIIEAVPVAVSFDKLDEVKRDVTEQLKEVEEKRWRVPSGGKRDAQDNVEEKRWRNAPGGKRDARDAEEKRWRVPSGGK
jgi:hypothetical protein